MLIRTRHVKLSRRSAFLILFGVMFILLGYSYLHIPPEFTPILRATLRLAELLAPLEFYGWTWIVCGAFALLGGLVHRLDWLGFAAAIIMPTYWASMYFLEQIVDGYPRAWVTGCVFAAFAGSIGLVAGMPDPLHPSPPRRLWRK